MTVETHQKKVLVLGADTRSFLSVVRSLGRYGAQVHAAWTVKGAIAHRSRYLHCVHDAVAPWEDDGDWLAGINALVEKHKFDLIVPCNDSCLIPLQKARHELSDSQRYYLLEGEVFKVVQSKVLSTELAESLGVRVPRHKSLSSVQQGLDFAQEVSYPVILKPSSSYSADNLKRKQKVVAAFNSNELKARLLPMLKTGHVQIQKSFSGVGTGVEFLAKAGQIVFAFQHLRLHEPLKGGGSSYRTSIPLHTEMLDAAKKIVAGLDYSGVGMIEFRWNRETDDWIFVEINGRFWGSLPLALTSNADFPKFLYQSRVEQISSFSQNYRAGVCCRNWERDKNWFSEQRSATGLIRFAKTVASELTACFWRTITLREHSDTFAWDDPMPALAEVSSITKSIGQGAFEKVRTKLRKSYFSRRRWNTRLKKHLANARSILFVCKGNICRSPFATEYAREHLPPEIKIAGAGYFPKSGRPAPDHAQFASKEFGVGLCSHRSVRLTEQLVSEADVVIVFDEENFDRVRSDMKDLANKVFLLNHIHLAGSLFVQDPYGSSESKFVSTYQEIKEAVDAINDSIVQPTAPLADLSSDSKVTASSYGVDSGISKLDA